LVKPLDILHFVHVPLPTLSDIQFIASLENSLGDGVLGTKYPKLRRVKSLLDRLQGRSARLFDEYHELGYNLYVSNFPDQKQLMEFYDLIADHPNKFSFYQRLAQHMFQEIAVLQPNMLAVGGSMVEINGMVRIGLDNLYNGGVGKQGDVAVQNATLTFALIELASKSAAFSVLVGTAVDKMD